MALLMNEEQRLKALESYNPTEHLISVGQNKDRSPVLYYPAAWRLYELRLRHPHFTLEAEILNMNEEKGTVIVKAIGYDGLDYASSRLKGTALKQGKIADLDKVETKAMSRVARNIGIGTEYALDFDDEDAPGPQQAPRPVPSGNSSADHPAPTRTAPANGAAKTAPGQNPALLKMIADAKARAEKNQLLWESTKRDTFGGKCPLDDMLTVQQVVQINAVLTTVENGAVVK